MAARACARKVASPHSIRLTASDALKISVNAAASPGVFSAVELRGLAAQRSAHRLCCLADMAHCNKSVTEFGEGDNHFAGFFGSSRENNPASIWRRKTGSRM